MKFPAKQSDARAAVFQLAILSSAAVAMVGLALAATTGRAAIHSADTAQQAAGDPGANAIVRKMAAHYSSLNSLRVIIVTSNTVSMKGKKTTTPLRETLAIQRPDMFAYSLYGPSAPGDTVISTLTASVLNNNRTQTRYLGPFKQYISGPATPLAAIFGMKDAVAGLASAPATATITSLFTASRIGQATVKALRSARLIGRKVINGTPVSILEFSPSAPGAFKDARVFLAVDVRSGRLVRGTLVASPTTVAAIPTADSRMKLTQTVQLVSENTPLPASLFTFHPPADAKLVDKIQPTFPGTQASGPKKLAPMVGQPAPDFSLQDVSGKTVDLNSLKGRTILMDFSASW